MLETLMMLQQRLVYPLSKGLEDRLESQADKGRHSSPTATADQNSYPPISQATSAPVHQHVIRGNLFFL